MKRRTALTTLIGVAMTLVLVAGCGGSAGNAGGAAKEAQETTQHAYAPYINPTDFTTEIDNKYFPKSRSWAWSA
jgi:flagellar basal body-associated protein FliL